MKKLMDEKYLTAIVIVSMVAFPLLELIGNIFGKTFFMQEQYLSLVGLLWSIFMIIYLILCIFKKEYRPKKIVLSDFFIITSIIFCVISIIFSKHIRFSLTGYKNYSETPLQVLGYFGLFIMCTNIKEEKNRKSILYTFLILGILEAAVAFLQRFDMWPTLCYLEPEGHRINHMAFGFTQNCNYFAAVALIFTSLFATKFIYSETIKEKIFCLFGSIICCLSAFITTTNISWLGTLAILFGILFIEFRIYFSNKDKQILRTHIKRFLVILVCFLGCFLTVTIPSGQLKKDTAQFKKDIQDIAKENKNSEETNVSNKPGSIYEANKFNKFGSGRGAIWRAGWYGFKKYPLTGVGFDIYNYSFILAPADVKFSLQNKAHCEYFHMFVTQGVFSGINYLLFCFYCCYFPLKKILESKSEFGKSNLTKMFLIALFAYFVQALINSSVTNVAPYKWILMGLILPRIEQTELKNIWSKIKNLSRKEIKFKKSK